MRAPDALEDRTARRRSTYFRCRTSIPRTSTRYFRERGVPRATGQHLRSSPPDREAVRPVPELVAIRRAQGGRIAFRITREKAGHCRLPYDPVPQLVCTSFQLRRLRCPWLLSI